MNNCSSKWRACFFAELATNQTIRKNSSLANLRLHVWAHLTMKDLEPNKPSLTMSTAYREYLERTPPATPIVANGPATNVQDGDGIVSGTSLILSQTPSNSFPSTLTPRSDEDVVSFEFLGLIFLGIDVHVLPICRHGASKNSNVLLLKNSTSQQLSSSWTCLRKSTSFKEKTLIKHPKFVDL